MSSSSPRLSSSSASSLSPTWERARAIIQKRVATFQYLKRVHSGSAHYLNTLLLTQEDLGFIYDNTRLRRRAKQYYIFGCSLAALLEIINVDDYVRSLISLISEYESWTDNVTGSSKMRNLFRKSRGDEESGPSSGASASSSGQFESGKSDPGDYTFLDVRVIPFDLDFLHTFCTLCDISAEVYAKILDSAGSSSPQLASSILDSLHKIDLRFKKFIAFANKELETLVRQGIKEELRLIDPLLARGAAGGLAADDWDGATASTLAPSIIDGHER